MEWVVGMVPSGVGQEGEDQHAAHGVPENVHRGSCRRGGVEFGEGESDESVDVRSDCRYTFDQARCAIALAVATNVEGEKVVAQIAELLADVRVATSVIVEPWDVKHQSLRFFLA